MIMCKTYESKTQINLFLKNIGRKTSFEGEKGHNSHNNGLILP